jgi:hypothetical protein
VQASWAPVKNLTAHLGVAVTVIPPNIWQDNMLTGSTPFVIYPRRQSSSSAPLAYGFTVTPSTLPIAYDLSTRLASISMRAIVTEEEVNPLRDPITGPLIAAR